MANRYVEEAMKNASDKLPKTMEEYGLMHPANAAMVPITHVQKLREEFNNRSTPNKSYDPIKFKD